MSGLVRTEEGGTNASPSSRPAVMTTERWLAVYVLAALAGLVVARKAFREFIPR